MHNENLIFDSLSIGKFSHGNVKIFNPETKSKVKIGKFCSIGQNVQILLGEHHTEWISTYPLRIYLNLKGKWRDGHPMTRGDVEIGNDVWIGANVTILSGIIVGDGAVIGANSLVTKNIEPYAIYAGNPAKFIRKRFSEEEIKSLLKIRWWDWPTRKIKENVGLLNGGNIRDFLKNNKD